MTIQLYGKQASVGQSCLLFIWSPEEEVYDQLAEASQWWLHHSLKALADQLKQLGLTLILRKGPSLPILKELIQESNANALFFNERYEPSIPNRDEEIKNVLVAENIEVKTFHSHTLFEPLAIKNKENQPYKVFTPFWKQCLKRHSIIATTGTFYFRCFKEKLEHNTCRKIIVVVQHSMASKAFTILDTW